ncbi:MAG: hypothetical protein K2X86_10935 [Cytophagaceae bacterium]|nr:hypothetical protein [Cytophagaceae bacterium]
MDTFEVIDFVSGMNTSGYQQYTYIDPSPLSGINYYRLKQIDFDVSSKLIFTPENVNSGSEVLLNGVNKDIV